VVPPERSQCSPASSSVERQLRGGGRFSARNRRLGVLFIALIANGINLLNINELYQQIVLGIILLLAVSIDRLGAQAPTLY